MTVIGTEPVPITYLDEKDPAVRDELIEVVERVAEAGAFTLGAELEAFEEEFAAYCGSRYAVGVSSGTDALTLALKAIGVGPGDEVIVPGNTFIATAEAVSLAGATVVPIDVDASTHLITAELVEAAITPRTACVIPVHLMGSTAAMDSIVALARRRSIKVVEDAAQAHGAIYLRRRVGTWGDAGCFSFYPTKNLGGWGDGGCIVTDDADLARHARLLRSHGEEPRYHHRIVGTTARLDALQASLLRVKLGRLDDRNEDRRRIACALDAALDGAGVQRPTRVAGGDHVHHLFVVRAAARDELRRHLDQRGIGNAVHYPHPIHRTPAYDSLGMGPGSLPVVERLAAEICTLPLFPTMSDEQISRVADAVHSFSEAA